MTWPGIIQNIVSDILFAGLLIVAAWLWTLASGRRSLQKFFNVSSYKTLVIYVSNLRVLPFGSVGPSGRKFSFQGQAVAYGEIQGANQIGNLFRFVIPKLAELSERIGRLLLSDIKVEILISPGSKSDLRTDAPFIALGTPVYSNASQYIEDIPKGAARFKLGSMTIAEVQTYSPDFRPTVASDSDPGLYDSNPPQYPMPSGSGGTGHESDSRAYIDFGGSANEYDPQAYIHRVTVPSFLTESPTPSGPTSITIEGLPAITDTTYAIVERLRDTDHKRSLFYVAGLSEFGTKGAAYYLASQWRILHRKYADKPFLILLHFDQKDYSRSYIVSERILPD